MKTWKRINMKLHKKEPKIAEIFRGQYEENTFSTSLPRVFSEW